ncbi:MAG: ATP-binding protein [Lachnospiraceae bacterium]|nr:ATP-binding protein [Lachnospiraceae bacterium]
MSLTNAQYDAVMRYYDDLRERHRYEQDLRIREISRTVPEIAALDDEIAVRSLEAAKLRIADPSHDLSGYSKAIHGISEKKKAVLRQHGYPEDYLDLTYDCPLCHDTGFADRKRCSCFDRISADILYGSSALREVLERENFGTFSYEWYDDASIDETTGHTPRQAAGEACAAAMDMFVPGKRKIRGNLYLCGNTGVGKTFLTHCIAKEAIDRGLSVLYFSSGGLFDALAEETFSKNAGGDLLRSLTDSCDLLVIDDLGTELVNAFTVSSLFRIINDRILAERSTIISTNLTLKELSDRYSERVFSRVTSHFRIHKLLGNDIRILKKLKSVR